MSDTPQDEVPELKLPDWIPPAAKFAAEKVYQRKLNQGTSDDIDLLNRLTSDERMKRVWTTLTSKRFASSKSTKRFANPMLFYFDCLARAKRKMATELRKKGGDFNQATAQLLESEADRLDRSPTEAPGAWPEQDCAIYCFFCGAYHIALDLNPLLSRVEIKDIFDDYSTVSSLFDHLSQKLCSIGLDYYAEELMRIAREVAKEIAERKDYMEADIKDSGWRIVDRRRSNQGVQSFAVQLARITHVIFGSPLCGTLASTANVALNLEKPYIRARIEEILDSHPYTGMGGQNAIPWN